MCSKQSKQVNCVHIGAVTEDMTGINTQYPFGPMNTKLNMMMLVPDYNCMLIGRCGFEPNASVI